MEQPERQTDLIVQTRLSSDGTQNTNNDNKISCRNRRNVHNYVIYATVNCYLHTGQSYCFVLVQVIYSNTRKCVALVLRAGFV